MLTSLRVHHFRCFQDIALERLGRLTLISGGNNAGKTALLESIFLLLACPSPAALLELSRRREGMRPGATESGDILLFPELAWEHLFRNRDLDSPVAIRAVLEGRPVSLAVQRGDMVDPCPLAVPDNREVRVLEKSSPGHFVLEQGSSRWTGTCTLLPEGVAVDWRPMPPADLLPRVAWGGDWDGVETSATQAFDAVKKAGLRHALVAALQEMDQDIEDITKVVDDVPRLYLKMKGGTSMPLSILGRSTNRLVHLFCVILASPGAVVLVDELEKSFHYSVLPHLWKNLEFLARKMDAQIIATTQSYECIEAVSMSVQNREAFCYIRLDRQDNRIEPKIYPDKALEYSLRRNLEVR